MVKNLYPQRWLDQLPGDGEQSIPPEEMSRAAQAETRAEHGRGRHATEYEVKRVRCERSGLGCVSADVAEGVCHVRRIAGPSPGLLAARVAGIRHGPNRPHDETQEQERERASRTLRFF